MSSLHSIHPYPCKFPAGVAREARQPGLIVVDPFVGSGTTLLEGAIGGSVATGFDVNPIAVLVSNAKLIDSPRYYESSELLLRALLAAAPGFQQSTAALHDFHGRDHWFSGEVQVEIAGVLAWMDEHAERESDEWVWLAASLSSLVVRFSRQDSETRYVRREKDFSSGDLADAFVEKCAVVRNAILERGPLVGSGRAFVGDVMEGLHLDDSSADLIVTSPPYANTMDYYLYHKQRMNVLGFDFKEAQTREIGSRHEFSSKKVSSEKWQLDLDTAFSEIARILKPGGRAVIVIGDSQIAGELLNAADAVALSASRAELKWIDDSSTAMSGQSRSFNAAFQAPNKMEHTIHLTKPE